jgi:hypothetical protein
MEEPDTYSGPRVWAAPSLPPKFPLMKREGY